MIRIKLPRTLPLLVVLLQPALLRGQELPTWQQWRGPTRDGQVRGSTWPASLTEDVLTLRWRVPLPPSYSGPIVTDAAVFVTGTADKKTEVVSALDRQSGKERWRAEWPGMLTVPFFAAKNGSWMRSTPACDGETLYVAGICDVLVALDAKTGQERWRVDFVKEWQSPLPAFGAVCSPLLDGDALYVQAGAALVRLDKKTGKIIWRVLKDEGGMMGGAFSSPVLATLAGRRQLVVQTRAQLAGVDPQTGDVLWEQKVPNFRGMNILTPVVFENAIFTSSYQNKSWLFTVTQVDEKFQIKEAWSNNAQGYMSTPVVVDGHAYLHLQNQRLTCLNLTTGERTWTSPAFGQYCSLVAQNDRILALDQRGRLLLFRANPKAFELLAERQVSDQDTWAHVAVCGDEVFVRERHAISVFLWKNVQAK